LELLVTENRNEEIIEVSEVLIDHASQLAVVIFAPHPAKLQTSDNLTTKPSNSNRSLAGGMPDILAKNFQHS
jgi:hypothetical protein